MAESAFYGAVLKIGDDVLSGSPAYTTVANVAAIGDVDVQAIFDDITNLSSTGSYKEYLPTLLDLADITLELNYDPAEATHDNASGGILYELIQKTAKAYQIIFADAGSTTWSFDAYVKRFSAGGEIDGKLRATAVLRPTGQPTLT